MVRSYDQQGYFQRVTSSELEVYQFIKFSVVARAADQGTTAEINTETSVWRAELGRGQIFSVSWS